MITGKTYDVLKLLAQLILPAVGTLYFTLAGIWGLPAAEEVVGTIVAVDAFLGVVLQITQVKFSTATVGEINVTETKAGVKKVSLDLDGDPESDLLDKDRAIFKVNS